MEHAKLFEEFQLGALTLPNRLVMAPMTRCRSTGNTPTPQVAQYYGQRAEAGLIITEGTSPSPNGLGYPRIPGLFSPEQIAGWRRVGQSVHRAGGRIFVQLMHTGRMGHPDNLPAGAQLLAPSPIAPNETMRTEAGSQPIPVPREMTESDIETALGEYETAAKNAIAAGLDGVELHGANGYLIDQFINSASNQRQDHWGRTVEGRSRFVEQVTRRVAAAIGPDRVGIRISPAGGFNAMVTDEDLTVIYTRLARSFAEVGIAYVHLVDHSSWGTPAPDPELLHAIRQNFTGALIFCGAYDAGRANAVLVEERCDLVAFGRPFIANPRLVSKLKHGRELRSPDFDTFYSSGDKGYIDYPLD